MAKDKRKNRCVLCGEPVIEGRDTCANCEERISKELNDCVDEKQNSVTEYDGSDLCVICGAPVPEGRFVCIKCEIEINRQLDD